MISAQNTDTMVWIEELSIEAGHLIGTDADSIPLEGGFGQMNALSDILRTESNVYFRNFGPGSSSTISMFGSRSNEVALIWNGIKVANPMLGVNDYSLISPTSLTSLHIARVGTSTIYGAGSSAGAIILGQEIEPGNKSVSLSAGWSTLRELKIAGAYNQSGGLWQSRTSIDGATGPNNFPYSALSGKTERLPHASHRYFNASHHSEFRPWNNQILSFSVWARDQSREIPPTLTEARSEADQSDRFIRSVLQYQNLQSRHKLHLKAYYGYQRQIYKNPLINLHATHIFENAQFRMDNQWQPGSEWYVKYGLKNNFFTSRSANYQDVKRQNRIAVYAQLEYDLNRWPLELTLLVQPEMVTEVETGWTVEMKMRYIHASLGQWILFANQNIVWPTLNDLYWNPGGNPELMPEKNRTAGLIWKKKWTGNFHHTLTMYHKRAENWIQWVPSNLGFWQPANAHNGISQGMNLELTKKLYRDLEVKGGYQYVRSVILDEPFADKQTIYSPRHMWSIRGLYQIAGRWHLRLTGEYTSSRYVTRDHNQFLDPYFLVHTGIDYQFKNHDWSLGLQVHNALDIQYQGIINRPMPGRQIHLNTRVKF